MIKSMRMSGGLIREPHLQTRVYCGVDLPGDVFAKLVEFAVAKDGCASLPLRLVSRSTREAVSSGLAELKSMIISTQKVEVLANWLLMLPVYCEGAGTEKRLLRITSLQSTGRQRQASEELSLVRGPECGAGTWLLQQPQPCPVKGGSHQWEPLVKALIESCAAMAGTVEFATRLGWDRHFPRMLTEETRLRVAPTGTMAAGKLCIHVPAQMSLKFVLQKELEILQKGLTLRFRHTDDACLRRLFLLTADALDRLDKEKSCDAAAVHRRRPRRTEVSIHVASNIQSNASDGPFSPKGTLMNATACRAFVLASN